VQTSGNPSPLSSSAQSLSASLPIAQSLTDLRARDLLTFTQLAKPCVLELFTLAKELKGTRHQQRSVLHNKSVILIFEKASLRTRLTFELGVGMLGGRAVYMDHSVQRLGEREAVKDYAKNLERWLHCIVARVYDQQIVEELAEHSSVPVINALSDRFHPCQALADLFTLWERAPHFEVEGKRLRIAYVGDGNNVCHSLMHAACTLGADITVVTPKRFDPADDIVAQCQQLCKASGSTLTIANKLSAVEAHHAVYTDVWISMGQADQAGKRLKVFADYQIDHELMARASMGLPARWGGAKFMHCLPARRGVEVTDEIIDSPNSIVYDQAENRLHAQNALLASILA
jgi:ornithine carbamoyltransferase